MQGYITIALDQQKYVDMAVNLAKSIKYFDRARRTCLVYNEKVTLDATARQYFDDFVLLSFDPDYLGCMNKIRIYDASPYDETMYIDADCLLVKDDIDRKWASAARSYFGMTGEKCTSGIWNNLDIAQTCRDFAIPYVVRMNSGVFYFRKTNEAQAFFVRLNELYAKHREQLSNIHQNRAGQYADEPFFGTAMGEFRIDPIEGEDAEGSWMVTTWRARGCRFDPIARVSSLKKPSRLLMGLPIVPWGWVSHSPTIAHFIGLKPPAVYRRAVAALDAAIERIPELQSSARRSAQ